jgi:hypothetical protein
MSYESSKITFLTRSVYLLFFRILRIKSKSYSSGCYAVKWPIIYRLIHVARSLETFWFPGIILIWKLVVDCGRLLRVQLKCFRGGGTSGSIGGRCHLCFFEWRGPVLTSHFDSALTFEFGASFCQYLSVIVFDLKSVSILNFHQHCILRWKFNRQHCLVKNASDCIC